MTPAGDEPLPKPVAVDYLAAMIRLTLPLRRRAAVLVAAAMLMAAALAVVAGPRPALAQSSSAVLSDALAAELRRPLTPPEAWAVTQAVRDHVGRLREARLALAARAGEAVGLATEAVVDLLPPLGRGPQSVEPPLAPALADRLARPLSPVEQEAVAAAEAERMAALDPHRRDLARRLAALTGVPAEQVLPLLPACGL